MNSTKTKYIYWPTYFIRAVKNAIFSLKKIVPIKIKINSSDQVNSETWKYYIFLIKPNQRLKTLPKMSGNVEIPIHMCWQIIESLQCPTTQKIIIKLIKWIVERSKQPLKYSFGSIGNAFNAHGSKIFLWLLYQ